MFRCGFLAPFAFYRHRNGPNRVELHSFYAVRAREWFQEKEVGFRFVNILLRAHKFHYGLTHSLLSLAVLIVPTNPKQFFPTRPDSVSNMAEFDLASRYFRLLLIPVPILLLGLLPEN